MKTLPKPDIVAFDLDGTLTELGTMGRFAANYVETIAGMGLRLAHHFYTAGAALAESVSPRLVLRDSWKKAIVSAISKPYPDTYETVSGLKNCGIRLGMMSNNSREAWGNRVAKYLNIGPEFDATMFREDMDGLKKPHPGPLLNLIRMLDDGGAPKTIWVVGDMPDDMRAAMEADKTSAHRIIPVAMGEKSLAAAYLMSHCDGDPFIIRQCSELLQAIEAGGPVSAPVALANTAPAAKPAGIALH